VRGRHGLHRDRRCFGAAFTGDTFRQLHDGPPGLRHHAHRRRRGPVLQQLALDDAQVQLIEASSKPQRQRGEDENNEQQPAAREGDTCDEHGLHDRGAGGFAGAIARHVETGFHPLAFAGIHRYEQQLVTVPEERSAQYRFDSAQCDH